MEFTILHESDLLLKGHFLSVTPVNRSEMEKTTTTCLLHTYLWAHGLCDVTKGMVIPPPGGCWPFPNLLLQVSF